MKRVVLKTVKWTLGSLLGLALAITLSLFIFEDQICSLIVDEMNKELKSPIKYTSVELTFWSSFPNLSVNMKDVEIEGTLKNQKASLFRSKNIRVVFDPFEIWNEKYEIKVAEINQGELNLKTNKNGKINYDILKESKDKKDPFKLVITSFYANDLKINYSNDSSGQYYSSTLENMKFSGNFDQEQFELKAQGKSKINEIKSGAVPLLVDKSLDLDLRLSIDTKKGTVKLPRSNVSVAGIPLIAKIDYSPNQFALSVAASGLKLTEVVNNLSLSEAEKQMNSYQGNGTVDLSLEINRDGEDQPSIIDCSFKINQGTLIEPLKHTKLSNIMLVGSYHSDGAIAKDVLKLEHLKFSSQAGPFSGNLKIQNFITPNVSGTANGNLDLATLHRLFQFPGIDKIAGDATVRSNFNLTMAERIKVNKMIGTLNLRNTEFKGKGDVRSFREVNAKIQLLEDQLHVSSATMKINESDLTLDGSLNNIYNYLSHKGILQVNCNVQSDNLAIEDLGETSKEEKERKPGKDFVLPNDIEGNIKILAENITYGRHDFRKVRTQLSINNGVLNFPNITVENAGAQIRGELSIKESKPELFQIDAELKGKNMEFKPLFREWNNFGQSVINADQISGISEVELFLSTPVDLFAGIDPELVKARAKITVINGHLKQVPALMDISTSLKTNSGKLLLGKNNIARFDNNLKDISFKNLENTLSFENGVVTIPKMHIESSALTMDLEGTHTVQNMMDYRMKFELRELLGEDRDAEFGTVLDDQSGVKVYLHMYGHIDNPIIEWDKSKKKQELMQQLTEEKQTVKSMLKEDFGWYKKDSSVVEYHEKVEAKERVKLNFKPKSEEENSASFKNETNVSGSKNNSTPPKNENRLKQKLNQWKSEETQAEAKFTVRKG
jgi:uncharacterized protein involved in outer membrane biogenesis